jgi:hypothetical protein
MLKSLINKILEIIPCTAFFRAFLQKFFSLIISLKVWILAGSSYLLWVGKIGEVSWVTIFTTIAIGRVAIQSVMTSKSGAKSLSHMGEATGKAPDDNLVD